MINEYPKITTFKTSGGNVFTLKTVKYKPFKKETAFLISKNGDVPYLLETERFEDIFKILLGE